MLLRGFVCLCVLFVAVRAISFELAANTQKCLQEDVHKDVLVVGEYEISDDDSEDMEIDLEITDSRGHHVYRKEDAVSGKFAFTSDNYDVYEICFRNSAHKDVKPEDHRVVTLVVKVGVEARSYDKVAKAEKLKPMEVQLRKLEDLSESIVQDFARMKKREAEHRDTNESTNERLLQFSIFSMVCLLVLAVWQVLYLKRYFKQKKLI
eukprot:m.40844 g.40844  ORF g.40844 m.40844 type:complete len:207 (+) comp16790_c0_seq1:39-659(+)